MKLTTKQREQLVDLARIARDGLSGAAFWYPTGAGEHRTAEALTAKGLLTRHFQPFAYEITKKGLEWASSHESSDDG